ncbi:LysE family transporter [Kitasatospora sp. NPDC001539]|uniref:LysE family transporter n=1 Tax=Kitasatospora sp. NPDC001539 TaxID=3154384 RepID=UPI003326E0C5
MSAALVAGLLAGLGVAVPVGAVGAYLVSLTARTSLRTGVHAALGVATADGLYALVAAVGGTGIAPLLEPVAGPLRFVSALVLLALAVRTAATALRHRRATAARGAGAPPDGAPPVRAAPPWAPADGTARGAGTPPRAGAPLQAPRPLRAYLTLLGVTLLNPLTVLYFAALVLGGGGRSGATSGPLARAAFTAGVFAASAGWQLLLAAGGTLLGRALTGSRGRLFTALGSAALVGGLAVRLLLTAG